MASRKAVVMLGGLGTYAAAVTASYLYLNNAGSTTGDNSSDNDCDDSSSSSCTKKKTSFVYDKERSQVFNSIASSYDSQINMDETVMGIKLLRRFLLYMYSEGEVLEVAAGTGRNIDYYPLSSVKRIILTDASSQMMSQAHNKILTKCDYEDKFVCVPATHGDASNLQFPDDSFDTVVDTFGLCSFEDPVAVLKEMQRVCKPNGKILLLEHGRSKTWESITRYLDKYADRHARNWGCCWNRDLDSIIHNSGLAVQSLRTFHFGTTYYVIANPNKQ